MLFGVAAAAIASVAALVTAIVIGSGVLAWLCVALSATGILLLVISALIDRRNASGSQPMKQSRRSEHHHTAEDDLFGEHDVARDIVGEERVLSPDMFGSEVPRDEVVQDLEHPSQRPGRRHGTH